VPRYAQLQFLHHDREISAGRLTEQQMNMLWHDRKAQQRESHLVAELRKFANKDVTRGSAREERFPAVTTEGDEMEIASAVIALQSGRHP
jgi:hypothetical protein